MGSVLGGVSLTPYEQTRRTALFASLGLGLAVLLLVAAAARRLLASSLRPVVRMTRQASAWSERTTAEYRQALEIVHGNAQRLSRIVDALVAAARHKAGTARGTADAFGVAAAATEACAGLAAERDLEVEVPPPQHPIRVGVDAQLAERILQPVVENACRYGRRTVRVSVDRSDGAGVYAVVDDGQGVAEDERERIFEPGARGRRARENGGSFVVRLPAG